MARALSIHFVGLKGVPATYGGVEHAVEEIGARLAGRGHQVVVHCRNHYTSPECTAYRGMILRREGSLRTKRLDTISHTLVGLLAALWARPDIIGIHNYPNGPLAVLGRWARIPMALHLHGFEWRLDKWNRRDKALLRLLFRPAMAAPRALTSVSKRQVDLIRRTTRRPVLYIPNGVSAPAWLHTGADLAHDLASLELEPDRYLLCVSRLVPQKGVEYLIRAYRSSGISFPLIVVGDHNHAPDYAALLRQEAGDDPRIRFLGYRFGDELWRLYAGCRLFVLPTEYEGMPLVLLEAMAAGCPILASRLSEIEEVGRSCVRYFQPRDPEDLRARMEAMLADGADRREAGAASAARAREHYSWDRVADAYEALYLDLAARK